MGLINSLGLTNFDLENQGPSGFFLSSPLPSYVPSTSTGTPSTNGSPGIFQAFTQQYRPSITYLSINTVRGKGQLLQTINPDVAIRTALSTFSPYTPAANDPTSYSRPSTTGTPTSRNNPGAPSKFKQQYSLEKPYVNSPNYKGILAGYNSSLDKTNLDTSNSSPNGGVPYKKDKDPTRFTRYTTGVPTTKANPGPFEKFDQKYKPGVGYLDTNPVKSKGKLIDTLANTNLDVENEKPDGGIPYKQVNDPTSYPARTQASSPSPGFFATPGKAAVKFNHKFNPQNTYLDSIGA
jgi:hypothetical protein